MRKPRSSVTATISISTLYWIISRLVRESLCFSKCKEMLDNHLDVYQCYNNLIRVNSALTIKTKKGEKGIERTPCIAEALQITFGHGRNC